MKFELCVDSYIETLIADRFSFDRIELCSALEVGGLTPNYGLIKEACKFSQLEVHTMIRPRPGGFVYSDNELIIMKEDIKVSYDLEAKGVVFGVLNQDKEIDMDRNYLLIDLANRFNLDATFHRAFDLVEDSEKAINQLIDLGFKRILTSGGASNAIDGIKNIQKYIEIADGRIEIMAGGDVNPTNAMDFSKTGIDALHFTARKTNKIKSKLNIGSEIEVDTEKIEKIIELFSVKEA